MSDGHLETLGPGRFRVDVGGMRAVAGAGAGVAELAFTYRGPSATTVPLASGELRRQIGLKLRAKDTCNVVYVMWHVEPSSGIFVLVKRNPNASTHAACGDRGYLSAVPTIAEAVAPIRVGEAHTLRADLRGDLLEVIADGRPAWRGRLPSAVLELEGPVGVRSDNGSFDFELRVPGGDRQELDCVAQL